MSIELVVGENELNIALTPKVIQVNVHPQAGLFIMTGTTGDRWVHARESATGSADMIDYGTQTGFYWYNNPRIYRGAIYFSLASIPAGATIIAAKLIAKVSAWKFGNGAVAWLPNDYILLDFPNYSWPIEPADYGLINELTDEIVRISPLEGIDVIRTFDFPQHTIDRMQGQSFFAIAEKCSADHDNVQPPSRTMFGARTYTAHAGYHAYLQIQVEMPE